MRRRQFIAGLGSAAAWPVAARAQQRKLRRVGALMPQAESDPEQQSWTTVFATRLRELGWTQGENVQIDYRWGGGDPRFAPLAKELVELQPDVLLAATTTAALVLRQYTLTIPIVFTQVSDAVAAGLVTNLARPEGNITGFNNFEFATAGKWLNLLKECSPGLTRAAIIFDPASSPWSMYVRAIEAAARSLAVGLIPFPVQSDAEIERALAGFARAANGGIVALPTGSVVLHCRKIIALAAQHSLPAMYPYRFFVAEGGLMSYGTNLPDLYRQAASYVDRILRGEKPVDLPVQQPTKFDLVINLKTAKALGLIIPETLLATADEVIQ
jgi:putative tryptophan/tyrosine transport system substrate-binding protein